VRVLYPLFLMGVLFGPGVLVGGVVAFVPSHSRGETGPGFKRAALLSLATILVGILLFALMAASAPSTEEDDMAGFGALIVGAFAVLNGIAMFIGGGIGTLLGGRSGGRHSHPASRS